MNADTDMTCAEVVELVTSYLEGRLPPDDVERFEAHLALCNGCRTYLEQMRATLAATRALPAEELPQPLQDSLLDAFRGWKAR